MAAFFGSATHSGGTPAIIARTAASDFADCPCIMAANASMWWLWAMYIR